MKEKKQPIVDKLKALYKKWVAPHIEKAISLYKKHVSISRGKTILFWACVEIIFIIVVWLCISGELKTLKGIPLNTVLGALIYAPILYIIWMFRNDDKQKELENNRIDTLTKDFHQIEKWATQAEGETKESLRIAAIHQLGPYMTGEHKVEFFRRPAYEIYRSLLDEWAKPLVGEKKDIETPEYIKAIHTVIREILLKKGRWEEVFTNDLPISQLNLFRADLRFVSLGGADLYRANLEGADLMRAHLEGATLWEAHLEGANLVGANLKGTSLGLANLESAYLINAHLEGADLEVYKLGDIRFSDTAYSNKTVWPDDFDPKSEPGLVNVDEQSPEKN